MTLLLLHAAATLAMTGVIWFVQLVHYPLLRFAAADDFERFAAAYQRRTTWVVLPLMSAEVATAIWIFVAGPEGSRALAAWGLALLAQVPLHRRLARGFDERAGGRLVGSNWLRTAAWSARAVVALAMLA